jgi:hypothetical protein
MASRVENNPVSRRQFYGTLVGVLAFVGMAITSVGETDAFRNRLVAFIAVAMLWALIELMRTRRTL